MNADTVTVISRTSIVQHTVPDSLRGRVNALGYLVGTSGPQLGNFRAGMVASATSGATSAVMGGFASLVGIAVVYMLTPSLREYRPAPDDQQGAGMIQPAQACAQHGGGGVPPIRLAYSLVGLHLALERGLTGDEVRATHQRMGRPDASWPVFVPPSDLGPITVMTVAEEGLMVASEAGHAAATKRWAHEVGVMARPARGGRAVDSSAAAGPLVPLTGRLPGMPPRKGGRYYDAAVLELAANNAAMGATASGVCAGAVTCRTG